MKNLILFVILGGFFLWTLNFFLSKPQKKSKAAGENFTAFFAPASTSASPNQTVTTTISIRPSLTVQLTGYHLKVYFDKTRLDVSSITYKLGAVSVGLGDDNTTLGNVNQNGFINFQGEIDAANGQTVDSTTDIPAVEVTFMNYSTTGTTVTVDAASSVIVVLDVTGSLSGFPNSLVEIPMSGSANYLINGGAPTIPPTPAVRLAECDECGLCQFYGELKPTPQTWERCRECLYPATKPNPASSLKTLLIDPKTDTGPTTVPGKKYTLIGCIETKVGGFSRPGGPGGVVQTILNILFAATGGVSLIFLLYGAFVLATSQAEPERLRYGKRLIYGAIIGAVFTFASLFIVNFIATGILKIPGLSR